MRRYTLIRGGDCSSSESGNMARRRSIGGGSGYGAKHDDNKSLELMLQLWWLASFASGKLNYQIYFLCRHCAVVKGLIDGRGAVFSFS